MTKPMDEGFIYIWTGQSTTGTGAKINNMATELRPGLMAQSTKVTTNTERNMVLVHSGGRTTLSTLESFTITTYTGRAFIPGAMAGGMRASGKITKCTEKEPSLGLMEEST